MGANPPAVTLAVVSPRASRATGATLIVKSVVIGTFPGNCTLLYIVKIKKKERNLYDTLSLRGQAGEGGEARERFAWKLHWHGP